jgi:hypothetical protein
MRLAMRLGDAVVQSVRRSQLPDSFQGLSTQQKDDALALADRLGWSARDPRLAGVGMEFVTGKVMMSAQERQSVTASWLAERGLNAAQRAEVLERMRNGGELDEVLDGNPEPEPPPLPPGTSVIHLGRVTVTASDRPTVLGATTIDGMAVSTGDFAKTVGQLLDDRPYLKVGIEALQLASAPLGYFAGKAIEHSPIGVAANDLLASATTAIAGSFADVGYNANDSTSAGVGIMAVGGLALGWGASRVTGFVASRLPSMAEAVTAKIAAFRGRVGNAGIDVAPGPANLMASNDRFYLNASRRADIDPNGAFDVIAHGSTHEIEVMTRNGAVMVDQRVAARLIQDSPGYAEGQPIRLLSCSTGACDTGFAQNLANKMGVPVQAPTDLVWAYGDGRMLVAPRMSTDPNSYLFNVPNKALEGTFRTFVPGKPQ